MMEKMDAFKVLHGMMRRYGRKPCVICGKMPWDEVDSFEVCRNCRPQFEIDLDRWVDCQIEANLLEEKEEGE